MKEIKDILSPIFTSEWVRCKKCGHSEESHYWNGGGRVEASGYDSCRVDGCRCVYDEKETEILPTVEEEALKGYTEELETFINSHYIAKEKVKALKMYKTGYIQHMQSKRAYDEGNGYDRAVEEINKSIDLMMEDNK